MKRIKEVEITWSFHYSHGHARIQSVSAQIVRCEAWLKNGHGELNIGLEQTGGGFEPGDHELIKSAMSLYILTDLVKKVVHRNENDRFHYISAELGICNDEDFTDTAMKVFVAAMMCLGVNRTSNSLPFPHFTHYDWVEERGVRLSWGEFVGRRHYAVFYKVPDMR